MGVWHHLPRWFVGVILCTGLFTHAAVYAHTKPSTKILTARITDARGRIATRSFYVDIYTATSRQSNRQFNTQQKLSPKPLAIVLHGRPATEQARKTLRTSHLRSTVRYLQQLGYIVAVPTRIGYGKSTGSDIEAAGTCYKRDYATGLQAASAQTLAVLNTLRRQANIATTGTVLLGHSYGGLVALATAARQPAGIRAVINISGGAGGNPRKHPKQPCGVRNLQQQLSQYGRRARHVPTVWIYAKNDQYWGKAIPRQWHNAYQQAGGIAHFYHVGRLGADGHTLFTHFPKVWQKKAAKWLRISK